MGGDGLLGQGAGQEIGLEDDLLPGLDELPDAAQQLDALADGSIHSGLFIGGQGNQRDGVLHNASETECGFDLPHYTTKARIMQTASCAQAFSFRPQRGKSCCG